MNTVEMILRRHQLKRTRLRQAVLEEIMQSESGLSHQDLSLLLAVPFNRVTLFRTLNVFEEVGIIHKVMDWSGVAKYAYTAPGQPRQVAHAHFCCEACKDIFCLDYEFSGEGIPVPQGFQKNGIEIKVKGICEQCRLGADQKHAKT